MAAITDRLVTLCELFVHVVVADGPSNEQERRYLKRLLLDLACQPQLPAELEARAEACVVGDRSLDQVLQELSERPAMGARRLIELCSLLAMTDGPLEDAEGQLLRRCAERLGPEAKGFLERLLQEEAVRESFVEKARIPL